MPLSDARSQFISAMKSRSLGLDDHEGLIADGQFHRCHAENKGPAGKNDGTYLLHINGQHAYGLFNNWTDGRGVQTWVYKNDQQRFSETERREIDRAVNAAKREHDAYKAKARAEARIKARRLWRHAEKAPADHPYCEAKRVEPDGLRTIRFKDGDRPLLIAMYGENGKLQNLQFIHTDGRKHGLCGGRQGKCHFWIAMPKQVERNTICICEGWATGESVFQATEYAVIIAFNAGNLYSVAKWVRERYPDHKIIICADDDWKIEGNPGTTKAKKAAQAVNGFVAIPKFGPARSTRDTDFNDMMIADGLDAVQRAIDQAIDSEAAALETEKSLPVILVEDGQIARAIDQAQEALLTAGVSIFVRGGMLVEPITRKRPASHDRVTEVTAFAALDHHKMSYLLNKCAAIFQRYDKKQKKLVSIDPPPKVTEGLITLRQWQFPEVVGIIGAPTMRPDGTILGKFGYDPTTRLWCQSDIDLPLIPERPTRAEAKAALRLYLDLLSEFPFVSRVDRAVALAANQTAIFAWCV